MKADLGNLSGASSAPFPPTRKDERGRTRMSETAARSDLMALAAKLDNHCRPLVHDWLAYQLTNEERDLIVSALRLAASQPDRSDPSPGPDVREAVIDVLVSQELKERASFVQGYLYGDEHVVRDVLLPWPEQELNRTKNEQEYVAALARAKAAIHADAVLSALTRPLGGFVQGSIARKQSSDPEGSSRTETAGGEA